MNQRATVYPGGAAAGAANGHGTASRAQHAGLTMQRYFTQAGVHPYDEVVWEKRHALITGEDGAVVFEQRDVEFPQFWSQMATNVVASKYFRGAPGGPQREHSVRQLIDRVVHTLATWGQRGGYFATEDDVAVFADELTYLLLHQKAAFNSPVWFNCGVEERPQCSACQPYHALVNTVYGPVPIGEIVENDLIGLPVYDKDGLTQVVAVKYNGRKPVYRLQLSDGFFVEATGDHLVCAHDQRRVHNVEWRRVDELCPGMVMRVYPHRPATITPSTMDVEVSEAALAGWLQANGSVGQDAGGSNRSLTLEFITADDEEFSWVERHLTNVFPKHHQKIRHEQSQDNALSTRRIRLYGEALRPFVERYELLRCGQDLRVPRCLWTASNDAVAAYLKSVCQADGYASVHGPRAQIAVATISEAWIQDLQVLLTRLGVYARLHTKLEKRCDRGNLYELDLSIRSERERFAQRIGFMSSQRQAALERSLGLKGETSPDIRYPAIVEVVALGEMDVYDLQTISGCYLSNSVLVHNCFINSVNDTMESILTLAKTEGMLFKWGSGTGTNLSPIRSSRERLAGGGMASGPVSFMKGYDAFAGVIKSGGKTRRAAKMVILEASHPDIVEFIRSKAEEEKKAWALIDAGYDGSLDGVAYASVFFQNSNNSVRVPNAFMQAVLDDTEWQTRYVTTGEPCQTYRARELMRMIAEATYICGDPGMQFDTTINDWHTCPNSGRIQASNPCSEYMFLDDTACNLASINLLQFLTAEQEFDVEAYRRAVELLILAQEIIVDNASYPTPVIERNSYAFRPLGLGYTNLGALLLARSLPYDSEAGRAYAAAVTALMTGQAYLTSAKIAQVKGAFASYAVNREPMLRVIRKHRDSLHTVDRRLVSGNLMQAAIDAWDDALALGIQYGYRNAQVTVLAPTGTISFMMDCDTTGIEPDIALIKYKKLAGGGMMKMINATVPLALQRLGYTKQHIKEIIQYIDEHETIEGAPYLQAMHLPVFDCAFRPSGGTRAIHYMGHIRMMAAVQPFLSGAISKTVNMPKDASVEEIEQAYIAGWRLGVKALAIYRDGCKRTQPLSTRAGTDTLAARRPARRRLPDERPAITHKFSIAGHEGYITVGMFDDGTPGEIFLVMAKEGSTISGLMDAFATSVSLALQYGVPLKALIDKFSHMRFEPAGFTNNREIPIAKSIMDYIFRWLASKFLNRDDRAQVGIVERLGEEEETPPAPLGTISSDLKRHAAEEQQHPFHLQEDAPSCAECGALMIRNGACYKCLNCGATSGCS